MKRGVFIVRRCAAKKLVDGSEVVSADIFVVDGYAVYADGDIWIEEDHKRMTSRQKVELTSEVHR